MATRLKPTRINVDNTPRVGDGAAYQNDNDFHWSMGGGDMSYEDFAWHTLTGTSLVIEDISNNITPSSNFTVSAGTVKPGIEYVLRVNTGNTAYTMTLGTGVTNPNSYKTELKPNTVNQFKFIATSTSQLELEGVDSAVVSEINWGEIDGTLSNQTDLQNALDQKLDKVTSTATNPRAYVVNADGSQATLPITDSTTSGAIVRRNGTQITVPATPSANTDATSKKYVDDQVSAATAGAVSDTAYGTSWNGVTGIAPSKNAVYDKISAMDTTISGKANDSDVVKLTGDQTIAGTKTFSTSPVVPSKTTDATNTGTAIATEAQVYKKQDTLVSGTNIKTINNNSLLGSGDIALNDVKVSATAPSSPTEGMVWYDTTNDQLKVYDGTNWNATGKEYNAGTGISIGNITKNGRQGPSPDGFHVPASSERESVKSILVTTFGLTSSSSTLQDYLKMPAAGERNYTDSSVKNQGTIGNYRSTTPNGNQVAFKMNFGSNYFYPKNNNSTGYACSIRCFKDTAISPDSRWEILYDGSSIATGAGVFYNSLLGLISLSGDGITWITIQDKNLGATTVYNNGDILSEANCGKYYQWGNNYGFPRASDATITTSSTKVNASNYGPGNYYSSDTFIIKNAWDSSNNQDLWGNTTSTFTVKNAITNTGVLSVNGQTGNVRIPTGLQESPNSTITGIKYIRHGTEADYANLSQYYTDTPGDTEFHCF